jgi:hypothetical protein
VGYTANWRNGRRLVWLTMVFFDLFAGLGVLSIVHDLVALHNVLSMSLTALTITEFHAKS